MLEAIALVEPRGPSEPLAYAFVELAFVDARDGVLRSAHLNAAKARAIHSELGNPRGVAVDHLATAYVEYLDGNSAAAWTDLSVCIRSLRDAEAIADLSLPFTLAAVIIVSTGGPMAKAATLGGAAAALDVASGRQATYTTLEWTTSYASSIATARDRLGTEAYEAAWQRGLGMTADEAVAYALG